MKKCSRCEQLFPATTEYFYKKESNKSGLYNICKICSNIQSHTYYKRKKDKYLVHKRNCKEKDLDYYANYYEYNKNKFLEYSKNYYEQNKNKILENRKNDRIQNKQKYAERDRNKRALELNAEGKHTKEDIKKLLIEQNHRCAYCSIDISNGYHIDHIIPLSKGGSNWPLNLCIACPKCNMKKHNKMPNEWQDYINYKKGE